MDDDDFITIVAEDLLVDRDEAERATQATLEVLAERLSAGQARDLAAQLPPRVAAWLATSGGPDPFGLDEFLRRIADRLGLDDPTAERYARAVFAALAEAVTRDELKDMAAELPKDFAPLLPRGRRARVITADVFLKRVAERAGLDVDGARRAAHAVLETLGERISGGEVDDLVARLPLQLHAPLRFGSERTGGKATRMTLDEFVRRIAEREGVGVDAAHDHVRAVLVALREAVGDDEWFDVTAQLPDAYLTELARA
jgi:uncharacterized protein (DUF2267 family)